MTRIGALLALLLTLTLAPLTLCAADKPFGGIGLQVVPTVTGELVVLNVLAGTPAAGAGLQPGDLVFRVDDFPLRGSDFGKVVSEHLWGPVGSRVELYYRRPGEAGERRVLLKRSALTPRLTVSPAGSGVAPGGKGN